MGSAAGSLGMNGSIDQFRMYGSAVVAKDIERLYATERVKYFAEK